MKPATRIAGVAVCAVALAGMAGAQSRNRQAPRGKPGEFDYYVLSLSWSPEHCAGPAGKGDTQQCGEGKRFGFVVHGLWPQYERGYPQDCAAGPRVSPDIVKRMLAIMPSERLIQHEWSKHGTCSGMNQADYFQTIEEVFRGLTVPDDYKAPVKQVYVNPNTIRKKFVSANPGFSGQTVRIDCGGRHLSEVRVCLTKDLKPRPCSSEVSDTCRGNEIIMQPVR